MRFVKVLLSVSMMAIIITGTASAQELTGRIGLTPQLGLVIPTGDLADVNDGLGATIGFAGGFSVEYFLNENIAIGGKIVYDRFGMDTDSIEAGLHEEFPDVSFEIDANWTVIEFGAFMRYIFTPNSPTRFSGSVGVIMGKPDGTIELSSQGITGKMETDISMALGLEVALGVIHLVSENMGVFGEVGFTHLMTDGKDVTITAVGESGTFESDINSQWFGVRGGITFLVGGN